MAIKVFSVQVKWHKKGDQNVLKKVPHLRNTKFYQNMHMLYTSHKESLASSCNVLQDRALETFWYNLLFAQLFLSIFVRKVIVKGIPYGIKKQIFLRAVKPVE